MSERTTIPSPDALVAHAGFIRAVARKLLLDDHEVDDVVQQTLLAAIEKPPARPGPLKPWLATVARNLARMRRRTEGRIDRREQAAARPESMPATGEIAGHLHPCGVVRQRGRRLRRRCFASDGTRLVMPAFGAYTGGLNVLDRAFGPVFDGRFNAWLMGDAQVYPMPAARLVPDELEPARASSAAAYPRRSLAGRPRPGS